MLGRAGLLLVIAGVRQSAGLLLRGPVCCHYMQTSAQTALKTHRGTKTRLHLDLTSLHGEGSHHGHRVVSNTGLPFSESLHNRTCFCLSECEHAGSVKVTKQRT